MTEDDKADMFGNVDIKKYVDLVNTALRETNAEFNIEDEIRDDQIGEYEDSVLLRLKKISRELYDELIYCKDTGMERDEKDVDVNIRLMLPLGILSASWTTAMLKYKSNIGFGDSAWMERMAGEMASFYSEIIGQSLAYGKQNLGRES